MLTKSELKSLWTKTNFTPLKRLGQNFLIDKNIRNKIVSSLDINPKDVVLEIGPGFGELTTSLAGKAKKVIAVEKDKKIVRILKEKYSLPNNIDVIESDFLDIDIKKIASGKKVIIYGNLPYYITSPVLEKIFKSIDYVKAAYLVIQKEVADRIVAKPGTRDIGRISLFAQYHSDPEKIFSIKKDSFFPVPKVESALLRLNVLDKKRVDVENESFLFKIIKICYTQRRKIILNSLTKLGIKKENLSRLLGDACINPQSRPEELSLEDFARITKVLS